MQGWLPWLEREIDYAELVVGVVIAWGVLDGVSTLVAATLVGIEFESNPLVRALLPTPSLAFSVKLGATVFAGALALTRKNLKKRPLPHPHRNRAATTPLRNRDRSRAAPHRPTEPIFVYLAGDHFRV